MGIGIYAVFVLEVSATMLSSRPGELGLEGGPGGGQISAAGLDKQMAAIGDFA